MVDPERYELSIKQKLESAISSIDNYKDRILLDDISIEYEVGKYKRDIQDSTNNHITKEELSSSLWVVVKAKGGKKSCFRRGYINQPNALDVLENLEDIIDQTVDKVIKKSEAKPPPKDTTNILMKGSVASVFIHEIVGHLLEGDIILKNSIFTDKYKQKIAPSSLTIKDVPYIKNGFGNCVYDDEGVEGKVVTLIKDGVISGIMTDRRTSAKLRCYGFDIELTGNGRVSSYNLEPVPRMRNTIMEHGSKNEEELIKELNSGIYLRSALRGQANIYTGDFVIYIDEAYWVEGGQLKYPVDLTQIKGNVMSALKNIVEIGSESTVETFSGTCTKAQFGIPVDLPTSCSAPSILFFDWNNM